MPATQYNVDMVNQTASKHEETASNIGQELDQLNSHISDVMARSTNEATKQMEVQCQNWVTDLKKSVLQHLNEMAKTMRMEVQGQDYTDEENKKAINNLSYETMSFLGS